MTDITVIIPTFNEAQNIEALLPRLARHLSDSTLSYELLVVDDDSPDGTAARARELGETNDWPVRAVIRTQNPGLSESVVDGLRVANGDICIVMDADLQHPPEKVPALAQAVADGADVAVGTRRADGGSLGDWSAVRRLVSRGGDWLARALAPAARRVSDPMSGFFAVRRSKVPIDRLKPRGFKILLEVLTVGDDLAVSEVGYTFGTREEGESKLTMNEYKRYVEHLLLCRFRSLGVDRVVDAERALKMTEFAGVGGLGVLVNMAVFLAVLAVGGHYLLAGVAAFIAAVQWNFIGNHLITFDESEGSVLTRYARFHAVSVGGFVLYELVLLVMMGALSFPPSPANIAAIMAGSVWNYLGSEQLVFGSL